MDIDLRKCKPGDGLLRRDGVRAEYLGKYLSDDYEHRVRGGGVDWYPIYNNGRLYSTEESGADIIAILPRDSCSRVAELEAEVAALKAQIAEKEPEAVDLSQCEFGDELVTRRDGLRRYICKVGEWHHIWNEASRVVGVRQRNGLCETSRGDYAGDIIRVLGQPSKENDE